MRKLFITALGLISIACLGGAVACSGSEPNYFTLTYEQVEGVSYDFKGIESGAEVKEGYVVSFTCTKDEDAKGEPKVQLNGNTLTAGEDGVYSFTMTSDSIITVTDVYVEEMCKISFVKGQNADGGDNRVTYHCDLGNVDEGFTVPVGTKVEFTIDVSVYYGNSEYTVLQNTTVLNAKDGVYSFTATGDNVNVTVTDLKTDEAFISRPDGGKGTAEDPYKISRPIDLYVMADRVGDDFWNGHYGAAHYVMTQDIDMKGEQLFVIGDTTSAVSFFCGVFDGAGHTISNYYIDDTIIEQANFTEVFLPYIGLFGQVQASENSPAVIKNLNLENFTINVNAAKFDSNFSVGGVVGASIGSDVINCNVSGKIVADADTSLFGYIGGVVGFQQSAYVSEELNFNSRVIGCSSAVEISGESGAVHTAGGISGYLYSYEDNTPAIIVNCYSTANVRGAMYTGGIVGMLSPYSSVKNCYSTAPYVEASNGVGIISGIADYAYAYAGGIAGYVDYSSVVSHCFATSEASAYAEAGDKYAKSGNIVGGTATASAEAADSVPALVFNNYSTLDKNAPSINNDFIKSTLGWSDKDWTFGEGYPAINAAAASKDFSVTVNYGEKKVGGSGNATVSLNDYLPVSVWYKDELDRFVNSDDGNRSYGYYFDIEGKLCPVPNSYVLTGGETLNAQFADYKEVAGKYYLRSDVNGSGIYIELSNDGVLSFADGARQYTSYYIYDGESVYLYECPALLERQVDDNNQVTEYMTVGKCTIADGVMTVINGVTYTQTAPLTALKEVTSFNSGKYYSSEPTDRDYVFYTDGTGLYGTSAMTYTINGNEIKITVGTSEKKGTVGADIITFGDGKTYTRYDMFEGVWEKSATTHKQYSFDGKGGWNYSYFGYNQTSGNKIDKDEASGTYTFNSADQSLELYVGSQLYAVASYDENGFIGIVKDGRTTTFYKQSSHVGVWRFAYKSEAIELTLNGIGADGFGKASIKYETLNDALDVLYDVRAVSDGTDSVDYINIYQGNNLIGSLRYNTISSTLGGTIYSFAAGEAVNDAVFCLYDAYRGKWISASDQLSVVDFNGFGQYDLNATQSAYATVGTAKMFNRTIKYKLDNSTMDGSFTLGVYTYKLSYNEDENVIDVIREKEGEAPLAFSLHRLDSWYGTELADESGTVYTFNGGGTLPDGGVMTAGEQKLTYKIVGDGVTVFDGQNEVGKIEIKDNSYIYVKHTTSAELSVVNSFTGTWTVGGGLDKTLTVGKINASGEAAGTYLGKDVTFTYDKQGKYLSFKDGDKTLYVLAMKAVGKEELAISEQNNTYGKYITCVKAENLDGLQGKYAASDGGYIVLDGLGTSVFGKGSAEVYDKDGKLVKSYTYLVNQFGMPYLKGEDTQVLKPCKPDANGAYKSDDKAFVFVKPDNFYGAVAQDKDYATNSVTYTFDGVGGIVASDGKKYSYSNVVVDKVKNLYNMDVVGEDGKTYKGEFDYGSNDYVLQLKEA